MKCIFSDRGVGKTAGKRFGGGEIHEMQCNDPNGDERSFW